MPTLNIRSVSAILVRSLKALFGLRSHYMEQEARELLDVCLSERRSVLDQIAAGWSRQARSPTAGEIDSWIATGRLRRLS
jgi:hypothetical protein